VLEFDARFRLAGHVALAVQVLTGFRLAQLRLPLSAWFGLEGYASTHSESCMARTDSSMAVRRGV